VRAGECARMDMNGQNLWRIVYRGCRCSFGKLEVFFEAVAFGARSFCTCALRLELFFVFETKFFSITHGVEEHTFFVV